MSSSLALVVLLLALSYAGSSLGQQTCQPNNFVADSFDVVNFQVLKSYHDYDNMLALYETEDEEYAYLFDLNTGTFYVDNQDGTCDKYQIPDAMVTEAQLQTSQQAFKTDDGTVTGYMLSQGKVGMNAVITESCQNVFSSFTVNGEVQLAFFHTGQTDFTYADPLKIQDALADFEAADCQLGNL